MSIGIGERAEIDQHKDGEAFATLKVITSSRVQTRRMENESMTLGFLKELLAPEKPESETKFP